MTPQITEQQIQAYIRSIELARAAGIQNEPMEGATGWGRREQHLPDEVEIRRAAGEANIDFAQLFEKLSPDMQQKLSNYNFDILFTKALSPTFAGRQGIHPSLNRPEGMPETGDVRVNVDYRPPFRSPYSGAHWPETYNPSSYGIGISPSHYFTDPTTGLPYWKGTEFGGEGHARGVLGHELAHAIDDKLVDDEGGKVLSWTRDTPEGRAFMNQGENKDASDSGERFAGLVMNVFRTGIVPSEFGEDFYNIMKSVIPNVERIHLGLSDVGEFGGKGESPYDAYQRIQIEADAGDASRRDELLAQARYLFSVDSSDSNKAGGKGLYPETKWTPLDRSDPSDPDKDDDLVPPSVFDRSQEINEQRMLAEAIALNNDPTGPRGEYGQTRPLPPMRPPREFGISEDVSDPAIHGEPAMGEFPSPYLVSQREWQQNDPKAQDWVKQKMDEEQVLRLTQAWKDQQKAGVGKEFASEFEPIGISRPGVMEDEFKPIGISESTAWDSDPLNLYGGDPQEMDTKDLDEVPPRFHVVKENDTLWGIAEKYGRSIVDLQTFNEIEDINMIRAGRLLKIPPAHGIYDRSWRPRSEGAQEPLLSETPGIDILNKLYELESLDGAIPNPDPDFYVRPPPGGWPDIDPDFYTRPPSGGWNNPDPEFYV